MQGRIAGELLTHVKGPDPFSVHGYRMFKRLSGVRGLAGALTVALLCAAVATALLSGGFNAADTSPGAMTKANHLPHLAREPISPLPAEIALDARKVALGERLFHDTRLSVDGTLACASCHHLDAGGVDRRARSVGVGGREGVANAPSVFNSGLNFRQFWDGRARTLEDQIDGPLQNPVEMGNTWQKALQTVAADAQYREAFRAIYEQGISAVNVKDALATFERSLITPNAPFDRYLRGERGAITDAQLEGYRLFKEIGCASCHQGMNVGGNMYQKLGIMGDYYVAQRVAGKADLGRFNITGKEEDKFHFRVPSLRNVAVTAPYLHDGSVATLEDAVRLMARYQLGKEPSDTDVQLLVGFLQTLTGEYRGKSLK